MSRMRRANSQENLALGKPATQSSVSIQWSAHQRLQDEAAGGNNGVIDGGQGFTTDFEPYPWWQVDLGAPHAILVVRIFNRRICADRLRHFSILGSLDGIRWIGLFTKSDDRVFGRRWVKSLVAPMPDGAIARYIRIRLNETGMLHFCELEVLRDRAREELPAALDARYHQDLNTRLARLRKGTAEGLERSDIEAELDEMRSLYPLDESELRKCAQAHAVLAHADTDGIGAQLRPSRGCITDSLLRGLAPTKLYLFECPAAQGVDAVTARPVDVLPEDIARRELTLRTRRASGTTCVMMDSSFVRAQHRVEEHPDWIFLELCGSYEQVLEDLRVSARMLRGGGLILGIGLDAKNWGPQHSAFRALCDFIGTSEFEFSSLGSEGAWCIRRRARTDKSVREVDAPSAAGAPAQAAAALPSTHFSSSYMLPVVLAGLDAVNATWEEPRDILRRLYDLRRFDRVADFGCGTAHWLHDARELGAKAVMGFDIPELTLAQRNLKEDEFKATDLTQPRHFDCRFDLAISTEVAEHLPKEAAATFVETLVKAADWVLFGAAVPFQGGMNHVNENWIEYWAALFQMHGYLCYDIVRLPLWHDVTVPFYYKQNTLLYVRAGTDGPLVARGIVPTARPVTMIHPDQYLSAVYNWPEPPKAILAATADYYRIVAAPETAASALAPKSATD